MYLPSSALLLSRLSRLNANLDCCFKTEPDAFDNIKVVLCSDSIVRHYDPNVLVLQCHVSSVGVEAALL